MKKIFLGSLLTAATLLGGSLSWHESVRVTRSRPVYREVTIRSPYQECHMQRVPVYHSDPTLPAAALIGAVTGGVIGHQIGDGQGRDAATIGGAVVGALVGTNIVQENRPVRYETRQICQERYREHRERRLVYYENIARYRGHQIVKRSQQPLKRIDLRITIHY